MLLAHPTGGSFTPSSNDDSGEVESLPVVMPVIVASPMADGSIVHIVQIGQTLWTIAAVYEVDLNELMALNGLPPSAIIHPDDEIIVRPGTSVTSTSTTSPTATRTSTPARTPSFESNEVGVSSTETMPEEVIRITLPASNPSLDNSSISTGDIPISTFVIIIVSFLLIAGVIAFGFIKDGEDKQSDENSL
jgi:hypothetical protein